MGGPETGPWIGVAIGGLGPLGVDHVLATLPAGGVAGVGAAPATVVGVELRLLAAGGDRGCLVVGHARPYRSDRENPHSPAVRIPNGQGRNGAEAPPGSVRPWRYGRPVLTPGREFEPVAEHAGAAYLRYSFTKGTEQEVEVVTDLLVLHPDARVLDVGCGPGRHVQALRRRGVEAIGVDISLPFLRLVGSPAVRADARSLPFPSSGLDAVICLCQGGFGLLGGDDEGRALGEMARVLRPGGRLVLSAFSSYFVVRHLEEGDTFDAVDGRNHERAEVRSEAGETRAFDLWTTCFTPRELRLMAAAAGLAVTGLWSVAPGRYARRPPDTEHPEWLLAAIRTGRPLR